MLQRYSQTIEKREIIGWARRLWGTKKNNCPLLKRLHKHTSHQTPTSNVLTPCLYIFPPITGLDKIFKCYSPWHSSNINNLKIFKALGVETIINDDTEERKNPNFRQRLPMQNTCRCAENHSPRPYRLMTQHWTHIEDTVGDRGSGGVREPQIY